MTLTPEQLATFWAIAATGRAPSADEMARAKARRARRGLDDMQQLQLELDLIEIMKQKTTFWLVDFDGTAIEIDVPPFDRSRVRRHVRKVLTDAATQRRRLRDAMCFDVVGRRQASELLSELMAEYRCQRRRLRHYSRERKNNKKTNK